MRGSAFYAAFSAVMALVILGLTSPVGADAMLPVRGGGDEIVAAAQPLDGGLLGLTIQATGQATYLGHFTGTELLTFNPAAGTFSGTRTFIAANGDELDADVEGAFTSPTTAAGTFTFTGGTGRFKNASGQANFEVVTPDQVHLTMSMDGQIKF